MSTARSWSNSARRNGPVLANPRLDAAHSGVTALAQSRKRRATWRARQAQRYAGSEMPATRVAAVLSCFLAVSCAVSTAPSQIEPFEPFLASFIGDAKFRAERTS